MCANDLEGIVAKVAAAPYTIVNGHSPVRRSQWTGHSHAHDRHEIVQPPVQLGVLGAYLQHDSLNARDAGAPSAMMVQELLSMAA